MRRIGTWRSGALAVALLTACSGTSFEPSDLGLDEPDGRRVLMDIIRRDEPAGGLDLTMDRPVLAFGRDTVYVVRAHDRGLYRWRADMTLERIQPEELAVGDTVDYWLTLHCCFAPAIAQIR